MGTTPLGITYPDPSGVPQRQDIESVATSVDTAIGTGIAAAFKTGSSAITTNAAGMATITHAHGIIPSGLLVQPELGSDGVYIAPTERANWTTTTFRVRAWRVTTGAVYVGPLSVVTYLMWP